MLAIIEDLADVPDFAKHTVEVAHLALVCVVDNKFPATPMIAHHWMVFGDFVKCEGWAVPMYTTSEHPYAQPGLDLLAGVKNAELHEPTRP